MIRFGAVRSGSPKMMSEPMTAGRAAAILLNSSAIRQRGQGHWPYLARLFASISTITTGGLASGEGKFRRSRSKDLSRRSLSKDGLKKDRLIRQQDTTTPIRRTFCAGLSLFFLQLAVILFTYGAEGLTNAPSVFGISRISRSCKDIFEPHSTILSSKASLSSSQEIPRSAAVVFI